ncbi:MAG: DUF3883 domain-containing protein [Ferruginibacter sp.]
MSKVIFFNTGWMDFYAGLRNDKITGGGRYVNERGYGHELFNFLNSNSYFYGYVQPKIDRKYNNPSSIKLERLGASKSAGKISGVTVIWTATDPIKKGTYIVGWYKNATVYRVCQKPPVKSNRKYENELFGFYAKSRDAKLLPFYERMVKIPRGKNGMGQSNVWYAENHPQFVQSVLDYVVKGAPAFIAKKKNKLGFHQRDLLKRLEVEKKAILTVSKHYRNLGYKIKSVEKDNVGWDLVATNGKDELFIEVKGLSGGNIGTELTPNEYKNLSIYKHCYRICIVIAVLNKPVLTIFAYSNDYKKWIDDKGTELKFQEIITARITT